MQNHSSLSYFQKLLRRVNYWWLLGLFLFMCLVSILSLRHNNQRMIGLREKVFVADQNNGDVEGALKELRGYVYGHMNTNLASGPNSVKPPIQLKYRYERLVAAEKARVADANSKIYTDAQNYCEQKFPNGLSGSGRIPCIKEYVDSHGVKEVPIADDLYKFDFVSPGWSPDLAGWSIVLLLLSGFLFAVRFGVERWLQYEIKQDH